ncbi:MAG: hypothetical protein OXF98_09530 [Rhodospirillaceae bacterium]|nr:hypothetical protein [Rhodospirillaceae bacterium]
MFNLLENDGKDIVYFYEAYVDGFRCSRPNQRRHRLRHRSAD